MLLKEANINLHAAVRGAITNVNPDVVVQVEVNAGSTKDRAYNRTPTYAAAVPMTAQVLSLSSSDLRQLDGLNIQGATRSIWLSGVLNVVNRESKTGGDRVTLPDGSVWLVTMVLERWPEWGRYALTQQNGA